MKSHPNGAGTILPGNKQVKIENRPGYVPPPPIPANLGKIPITIYLTPRQLAMVQEMAANDEHACIEDAILHDLRAGAVEFYSCYGGPKTSVVQADWESRGAPAQLVTVTLDHRASALVRDYTNNGHPTLTDGHDPRDLMSAAVVFLLEEPDNDSDWISSDDALERAHERRLAVNGKEAP